jgi:hypothetical protein
MAFEKLKFAVSDRVDDIKYNRFLKAEQKRTNAERREAYELEYARIFSLSEEEQNAQKERIERFAGKVALVTNFYYGRENDDFYKRVENLSLGILNSIDPALEVFTIQTIIGKRLEDRFQDFAMTRERLRSGLRSKASEKDFGPQPEILNTEIRGMGFGALAVADTLAEIEDYSHYSGKHGLIAIVSALELPKELDYSALTGGGLALIDGVDEQGQIVWRQVMSNQEARA